MCKMENFFTDIDGDDVTLLAFQQHCAKVSKEPQIGVGKVTMVRI